MDPSSTSSSVVQFLKDYWPLLLFGAVVLITVIYAGRRLVHRLGIMGELMGFLAKRKLWWMIPMMAAMLLIALVIFLATATPAGVFIYPLF
jgi:hypothetical protein